MKKYVWSVLVACLIVGFQNCGGAGYEAEDVESQGSGLLGSQSTPSASEEPALEPDTTINIGAAALAPEPTASLDSTPSVRVIAGFLSAPTNTTTTSVWVVKGDGGDVQSPTGGRALDVDASALRAAGVGVLGQNKYLGASSVMNGFRILESDLAKAQALGFARVASSQSPAVSCAGKEALMIFGQSNSANAGSTRDSAPISGAYMFRDGFCFPARDPLLGATIHNGGGSVGMQLLRKYRAAYPSREVVIYSFGVGGSSVGDWASGRQRARLTAALMSARGVLNVTKIFWHQGETDTQLRTSEAAYMASFLQIKSGIRSAGFSAPIYVAVASSLAYRPMWVSRAVQNAQLRLIHEQPDIYLAAVSDYLTADDRASDQLHLSSLGARRLADQFFKNAFSTAPPDMITAYYQTYLSRTPTASEHAYWAPVASARTLIAGSEEALVRDLYRTYANRLASKAEHDYWIDYGRTHGRAKLAADFPVAVRAAIDNADFDASIYEYVNLSGIYNPLGLTRVIQPRLNRWSFDSLNGVWVRR